MGDSLGKEPSVPINIASKADGRPDASRRHARAGWLGRPSNFHQTFINDPIKSRWSGLFLSAHSNLRPPIEHQSFLNTKIVRDSPHLRRIPAAYHSSPHETRSITTLNRPCSTSSRSCRRRGGGHTPLTGRTREERAQGRHSNHVSCGGARESVEGSRAEWRIERVQSTADVLVCVFPVGIEGSGKLQWYMAANRRDNAGKEYQLSLPWQDTMPPANVRYLCIQGLTTKPQHRSIQTC